MAFERRHFILLVDRATLDEQRKVTDYLKSLEVGWWHNFQDSWLFVSPAGKLIEEDQIARDLQAVLGRGSFLVLRGKPVLGAGHLPDMPDAVPWLLNYWQLARGNPDEES